MIMGTAPVWTVNPDAIWLGPNPLTIASQQWNPDDMDALLVCLTPDRAHGTDSAGDFSLDVNGRLSRGAGVIYGGVQIINTTRLDDIDDQVFSLNALWDILLAEKRCHGVLYPGHWCDVGRPENIEIAEVLLRTADAV